MEEKNTHYGLCHRTLKRPLSLPLGREDPRDNSEGCHDWESEHDDLGTAFI